MNDRIIIFDTTLRDGEQSPGVTLTSKDKMAIALQLDELGVDIIEAGFAAASKEEIISIQKISQALSKSTVCTLARAVNNDIILAGEALSKSKARTRIHTFISTSDIHIKYQLNKTREQVIQDIRNSVTLAKDLCDEVEWSGMDATRSEKEFLYEAIFTAIDAGATTINIPDTVGYALPNEFHNLILDIKKNVSNITDKIILSVHCHNDLGLAVANSLSAVNAGARQIECTVNGLGERAGNAAIEEVVMAIKTRNDLLPYQVDIKTEKFNKISKLVSATTGFIVQKNKAIVGDNAFVHESGIHQDGMLKNQSTYEIMTPQSVGFSISGIKIGKHSGRAALIDKIKSLGLELSDQDFQDFFVKFKKVADHKKNIYDEDIIAIIKNKEVQNDGILKLSNLRVNYINDEQAEAEISILVDGIIKSEINIKSGAIDAIFSGIQSISPIEVNLDYYQVHSIGSGSDAYADTIVRLKHNDKVFSGNGKHNDTLYSSAIAYINAINKILTQENSNK